jgi:hypothetical protein
VQLTRTNDIEICEFIEGMLRLFIIIMETNLKEKFVLCNELNKKITLQKEEITKKVETQCKPISDKWNRMKIAYNVKLAAANRKIEQEKVAL